MGVARWFDRFVPSRWHAAPTCWDKRQLRSRPCAAEGVVPRATRSLSWKKSWGWSYHEVVVKEGRVYDAFTGGEGVAIADYKSLWEFPDHINFGF